MKADSSDSLSSLVKVAVSGDSTPTFSIMFSMTTSVSLNLFLILDLRPPFSDDPGSSGRALSSAVQLDVAAVWLDADPAPGRWIDG